MQVLEDDIRIGYGFHTCHLINLRRQRHADLELIVGIWYPAFLCELIDCALLGCFAGLQSASACGSGRCGVADIYAVHDLRFAAFGCIATGDGDSVTLFDTFVFPHFVAILIGQAIDVDTIVTVHHVEATIDRGLNLSYVAGNLVLILIRELKQLTECEFVGQEIMQFRGIGFVFAVVVGDESDLP